MPPGTLRNSLESRVLPDLAGNLPDYPKAATGPKQLSGGCFACLDLINWATGAVALQFCGQPSAIRVEGHPWWHPGFRNGDGTAPWLHR